MSAQGAGVLGPFLRARRTDHLVTRLENLPDERSANRPGGSDGHDAHAADSVGLALLIVLDTLAPAERLAFVLHDLFGLPFEEIAAMVEWTPTAARQLAGRARRRARPTAIVRLSRHAVAPRARQRRRRGSRHRRRAARHGDQVHDRGRQDRRDRRHLRSAAPPDDRRSPAGQRLKPAAIRTSPKQGDRSGCRLSPVRSRASPLPARSRRGRDRLAATDTSAEIRIASRALPPVGESRSVPLAPWLLAGDQLGTTIFDLQARLALGSWPNPPSSQCTPEATSRSRRRPNRRRSRPPRIGTDLPAAIWRHFCDR